MVTFFPIPKQPKHYFIFLVAVLIGFRLAGKEVLARFATTFADPEERDASAQSRVELWAACRDVMAKNPVFGVGPFCFGVVTPQYGYQLGKSAHSLWFQEGAELGIPGVAFLMGFYFLCVKRLWRFRHDRPELDPWLPSSVRMVTSSLVGFGISAQFVSLEGLELPFYVTLIGAGTLKLLRVGGGVKITRVRTAHVHAGRLARRVDEYGQLLGRQLQPYEQRPILHPDHLTGRRDQRKPGEDRRLPAMIYVSYAKTV